MSPYEWENKSSGSFQSFVSIDYDPSVGILYSPADLSAGCQTGCWCTFRIQKVQFLQDTRLNLKQPTDLYTSTYKWRNKSVTILSLQWKFQNNAVHWKFEKNIRDQIIDLLSSLHFKQTKSPMCWPSWRVQCLFPNIITRYYFQEYRSGSFTWHVKMVSKLIDLYYTGKLA